jgi:hypothetical protein
MENENKNALFGLMMIGSGSIAAIASLVFMIASIVGPPGFSSLSDEQCLQYAGWTIIVFAVIFVIGLLVVEADSANEIRALREKVKAQKKERESIGQALVALQCCITERPEKIPVPEMRMINAVVGYLGLSVGYDEEKFKEWKGKILVAASEKA